MAQFLKKIYQSTLVKETAIYGLTNALYTGLPLLLMPFLVAILSPEDYGLIDLYKSVCLVLTPILGLSAIQSISRFFFDYDEKTFKDYISTIIIFYFINGIIAICLLLIVGLFIESKYLIMTFLAIIYSIFNQITEALLAIYRVKGKPKKYSVLRLGSILLDLLLLFIFYILYTHYNWTYRVIPNVLSTTIIGLLVIYLFFFRYSFKFTLNKELLKTTLIYSTPLILYMISGYILNIGDRFFIVHFLGEEDLGNYSISYQLGMSISFLYTSFNLSWTPTFYKWMKEGLFEKIDKVKRYIYILLPICGVFVVSFWIIILNYIPNFHKYNVPLALIIIVSVSYIILSYYKFEANYLYFYKKTKLLGLISLLSAFISVILNIMLLPRIGMIGGAISTLITFIILYISVILGNKQYKYEKKNT
ncbi:MAG: lipopolysaccharide biosynthesis protein [Dysgonomonas sp.]